MNVDNVVKTLLARCKELVTTSTYADVTRKNSSSILGTTALDILIRDGAVMLPDEKRAVCPHPEWAPETRDNGWRSYCLKCGQPAAGSCQG